MFNPHIHQQQQQQQHQFHQHLRQLQHLFQQQPPPPPPPQPPPGHHVPHHHHQTPRAIPVTPQTAPPPRMVNLCQASQTTIIAPNPMLQGALLMQQMQGNMRSFGMGGQQFRQFFGARSSLLGPVPMGMAIKTPMMGFPAARPFHPHARYYNNTTPSTSTASTSTFSSISATDTAARQPDRKRDSEQMAAGSSEEQPAASSTTDSSDKRETDTAVGGVDGLSQPAEEGLEEPAVKKQKTEQSHEPKEQCVAEVTTVADTDGDLLSSVCNRNTQDSQPEDVLLEEGGPSGGSDVIEELRESRAAEVHSCLSAQSLSGVLCEDERPVDLLEDEMLEDKDELLASKENQEEGDDGVGDGASKFYCYLCGITCHNQQNFRSHMNSMSHQQRMMEIQHMSNACLVTLLPRVQESLQGAMRDGEKKEDLKHWCATCQTHFHSSILDHRRTPEHKLASRVAVSSCTVCKKHFRTSQIFVEHLQSQEHRQKVEKLQEEEGCKTLGDLTATDTDGLTLEEVEGSEVEEGDEDQGNEGGDDDADKQDGWSSVKEVTLKKMALDEQYDPDTVYGSSFLVPVAGFICRLCNKFYHFESSALHSHCKTQKHFENLKRQKELLSEKAKAAESSRESLLASDSLRPTTETTTDWLNENFLFEDTTSVTDVNPIQPNLTPTQLTEPDSIPCDLINTSETNAVSTDKDQDVDLEPAATAEVEEDEGEIPAEKGKKNSTGKAKTTSKRRTGRSANRR